MVSNLSPCLRHTAQLAVDQNLATHTARNLGGWSEGRVQQEKPGYWWLPTLASRNQEKRWEEEKLEDLNLWSMLIICWPIHLHSLAANPPNICWNTLQATKIWLEWMPDSSCIAVCEIRIRAQPLRWKDTSVRSIASVEYRSFLLLSFAPCSLCCCKCS